MNDYEFGNFIYSLRKRKGLSQFQLGALVGVSDKAVSKWETGKAKPQTDVCYKLARELDITMDELLSCKYNSSESDDKGANKMNHELWKQAENRLFELYGDAPPIEILNRFFAEQESLKGSDCISYFGYLSELAKLAKSKNYLVWEKTGSLFVLWLLGGTDVNPLPPHYYCPKCHKIEFRKDVYDGFDLPVKYCDCNTKLIRDGHNIPYANSAYSHSSLHFTFEVAESFYKDAEDLLFSYFKNTNLSKIRCYSENGANGFFCYWDVPKTIEYKTELDTGALLVPDEDYYFKYKNRIAITISVNKFLEPLHIMSERTNQPSGKIDFPSKDVLEFVKSNQVPDLLSSWKKASNETWNFLNASSFSDYVRAEGVLHGANLWYENGKRLIEDGIADKHEIIAFREDIYYKILNCAGVEHNVSDFAYKVERDVRKSKYYSEGMPQHIENSLKALGIEDWYIDSLKQCIYVLRKDFIVSLVQYKLMLVWYYIHYQREFESMQKNPLVVPTVQDELNR